MVRPRVVLHLASEQLFERLDKQLQATPTVLGEVPALGVEQQHEAFGLHEVRIGTIKASVWRRSPAFPCSVGLTRLYRDGRQWKESSRFAHEDLPAIRLALDLAYEWLFELAHAEASAAASPEQAVETPAPAPSSACDHTHQALDDDGRPTGSWTIDSAGGKPRVVCGVCGKFYGFLPPSKREQAMQHAYQLQQQRLSCPGCGEAPFLS